MEDDVQTLETNAPTIQPTRADRIREASSAPDFSMPEIRPVDDFFTESMMSMDDRTLNDMMRETGIYASTGKQTATAIENALMGMNQLGDEMRISYGNLANYFTGSSVGDEMAKIAYDSITQRYAEMANNEEAIGGIRSNLAQLAGGGTSFLQLALEGIATAGVLPLAHIGVQEFGQGTYNDMKAYADEHDGSLNGYQPKGFDLAANTANALLQVGIEAWLGVGSPRFMVGASRGLWTEGLSGALQEGVQGALHDLNEAIKGNEEISILLDNAEDYLRDAIVGGILQGGLGAVTHHQNYARAVNNTSEAIAKARGHEEPTAEDKQQAQAIIDAKEREEASILTKEFKAAFDASSGEGQLQKKIADALNAAVKNKELDFDTADETELAQRIEQIATQETMNAMDLAREQNRSIADMELNNIVYKDGAIWLEGLTPEVGDKAVSYARVLAERQSGLAEVNSKLDAINQEIATLKQDLAEAKAENKQAQVEKLQARIDKQNALAEKNRLQAERLKVQTAKLEKQIAKQEEKAKIPETVETEKVSAEVKPVSKKSDAEVLGIFAKAKTSGKIQLDNWENVRWSSLLSAGDTYQKGKRNKPATEAEKAEFARKMLDKYIPNWESVETPKREVLAKVEPKPVVRTSLKKERAIKKTQTGITRKLDADSKFVKVIDKPANVDFSDGKEYEDSSKRYLLNKVVIKEQDGNLYFKLTGSRYAPTSYVVIEDYAKTDPYEIYSAQVEEGKEIGDHFDRAVQDFYKEKGLWSLAEPVKLRSWEEYMKDTAQATAQPSEQVATQVDESSLERYDPNKQYNKYDMVRVKTKSGEHIGVWDGERMTLHNSIEEAQEFIKNDIEREEADKKADERRAEAKKQEAEKQEKAFREGQGFVDMPYIIQLLKDNDMWEGLSLREKGNFNAIGSVMFSNGRIVNAFGNENSKKGTKVTQNTLDTIQKLRDKVNQPKTDESLDFSEVTETNGEGYKQKTVDGIIVEEVEVLGSLQDVATKAKYGIESKSGNWSMFTIDYRLGVITMQPDLDYFPFNFSLLEYENSGKDFAHWAADKIDEFRNEQKGKDEFEFANQYAKEHSFKKATENNPIYEEGKDKLLQGSITGKGDTARGGYDDVLKRIILGEKSDLSTIQHEFAHYWIQNNFKWARSGLASQDWLRRWRDVEEWLGIEPQDRLLSKSASEKFAKAYERYILEGKVAPELQWAFEGFQKAYQDIYEDLENEYFDLSEELAPEVVDWFNRNKEQSPKRLLQSDEQKIEKALTLAAGGAVVEQAGTDAVVMTENNEKGEPVVTMGVKQSEVPAGDNLLVYSDKATASKLQQSARKVFGEDVEVQKLATLDTQATLENFTNWIKRDRAGAWDAMMDPSTSPIYQAYLYKAFAQEAMNDVDLAVQLANVDIAKAAREMGQAVQALNINNESGFDMLEIIRNLEKSKGTMSDEELNNSIEEMGLDVEMTEEQVEELKNETECKL